MRVLFTSLMALLLIAWSPAPQASGSDDLDAAPRGPVNRTEILERVQEHEDAGDARRGDLDAAPRGPVNRTEILERVQEHEDADDARRGDNGGRTGITEGTASMDERETASRRGPR